MGGLPKILIPQFQWNIFSNIFNKIWLTLIISWKYLLFSVFYDNHWYGIAMDVTTTIQIGKKEADTTI